MNDFFRDFFNVFRESGVRLRRRYRGQYYRFLQSMWAEPNINRQVQSLFGLINIVFLVVMLSWFTVQGDRINPVPLDVAAIARHVKEINPFFSRIPLPILEFFVLRVSPTTLRYAILPVLAVTLVFIAGARFVRDMYELETFRQGLHHMISSVFALFYPKVVIDEGQIKLEQGKVSLIQALGGPGFALIQPGNVVQFRQWRGLTNSSTSRSYYLSHFESVELAVSLEDQVGFSAAEVYETQEGIPVTFKNIRYVYRILPEESNFQRSLQVPYSYSPEALNKFVFLRSVGPEGLRTWQRNISFAIDGPIREYVSNHSIDTLMAPGLDEQAVREEIRQQVMNQRPLETWGAQLQWIDIGQIEVAMFDEVINKQRLERWAVDWKGQAAVTRAYGEAHLLAFLEISRADAQAEAIKSIVQSLKDVDWQKDEVTRLRRILLSQTAVFLQTLLTDSSSSD